MKNFKFRFLKRTLWQIWLADKFEVSFQKASTYLKFRNLFFFLVFKSIFAKCEWYISDSNARMKQHRFQCAARQARRKVLEFGGAIALELAKGWGGG